MLHDEKTAERYPCCNGSYPSRVCRQAKDGAEFGCEDGAGADDHHATNEALDNLYSVGGGR